MTTYQNNRGEKWLLVEVPDDAVNIYINGYGSHVCYQTDSTFIHSEAIMPCYSYTLICTSDQITEEQARMVVNALNIDDRWPNYKSDYPIWFHSSKQSFQSLLHSLNLSRVVVLKIEE